MEDSTRFPELADLCRNLSQIEFVWFLGWNIAAGLWGGVGLNEAAGRGLLLDLFSKLQGGGLKVVDESGGRLQQRLMSLRRGTFEEIQREAPFLRHAQRNMESLLRAWMHQGETGYLQVWEEVFQPGWESAREPQNPIQIIGNVGDCEERALEVKGAPDGKTRVAAEWWYLYHTFGSNWKPGMHFTTGADEGGAHFSVHNITVLPDGGRRVYFRLPW